jgi:hypothetical protein
VPCASATDDCAPAVVLLSPMEEGIMELRRKYGNDAEALAALDQIAREPEMHRRYSDHYAYEVFVGRRFPQREEI